MGTAVWGGAGGVGVEGAVIASGSCGVVKGGFWIGKWIMDLDALPAFVGVLGRSRRGELSWR